MFEYELRFANLVGTQQTIKVASGQLLFVLGPNGSGKSTLMQLFASGNHGRVRRLTAHRQVWFQSDAVDLTPQGRLQTENSISAADTQAESRWRDDYAAQRAQAIVFDLIESENIEARRIAEAAREGNLDLVRQLASAKSPISKINEILAISNLHYEVVVSEGGRLEAVRAGHAPYSIAQLSDGERNALMTAATVLTAKPDSLILIDEPERHLHRAVVSPLLSTLLAQRPDCAFVVSTHDISLPLDQSECSALLIRQYCHSPQQWLADHLPKVEELDERTAEAVLGSRRQILFVEGDISSLDLQIYQILFPALSIKAVGSCTEVMRTVRGLNSAEGNHWIRPIGLIDRDNRDDEECTALAADGIFALEHYSIESLYYHPGVVAVVAEHCCESPGEAVSAATARGIQSIVAHRDRLIARLAERRIRNLVQSSAPTWVDIQSGRSSVEIDGSHLSSEEAAYFDQLSSNNDLGKLVSRYPVRETPFPTEVSRALGFANRHAYEGAVRKLAASSESCRLELFGLLRPIKDVLNSSESLA